MSRLYFHAPTSTTELHGSQPTNYKEIEMTSSDPEAWTAGDLIHHHAKRAASYHRETSNIITTLPADIESAEFRTASQQIARSAEAGTTHLTAALLMHLIVTEAPELAERALNVVFGIIPDRGALNGEWEDAAKALLREYSS